MSAYTGLASGYDGFTSDIPYIKFADFYEEIFRNRNKKPKVLLDLACGTGTLTLEMAKRGYELIAVDASYDMLTALGEKVYDAENIVRPVMLCQKMQELDLYGTVDAVYSSLDSINYIPSKDISEILRRLALFTEPEGLFIFDINTPERLKSLGGQIFADENEESLCLWRAEWNENEKTLHYGMDIFTQEGKLWSRKQEEHIEYAHEIEFLKNELSEAGYYNIEIIDNAVHANEGRVFIVAENSGKGMKK